MIKLAIAGINGRMGQSIYRCLNDSENGLQDVVTLSVASAKPDDAIIGKRLHELFGTHNDLVVTESLSDDFDVLIDFTSVEATLAHLDFCRQHKKAIVIGTTGFSDSELDVIHKAAQDIPVFMSANMSLGVNLMMLLVSQAAKALSQQADIEIVEAHHKHKVDAPSGTAVMLGKAIADTLGQTFSDIAVMSREGIIGPREPGTIGFSTIRGGDVVGEHTAGFYMQDERIEISHKATDRSIFARGALFAAQALAHKDVGLYSMIDFLDLSI